jgi:hypothetical protein
MHTTMQSFKSDQEGASKKECNAIECESNAITNHRQVISSRKFLNLERW